MQLVYVSGAMTASEHHPDVEVNYQRLFDASRMLFDRGYAIYCPQTRWFDEDKRYMKMLEADPFGEMFKRIIKMDLCILKRCDAIYLTTGWRHSRGAQIEYTTALIYNLRIMGEV